LISFILLIIKYTLIPFILHLNAFYLIENLLKID
jgi:hypothetical protein